LASYFKQLSSGEWEFQLPADPAASEAYRQPIGFVTTGFVPGRLVIIPLANFVSDFCGRSSTCFQLFGSISSQEICENVRVLMVSQKAF